MYLFIVTFLIAYYKKTANNRFLFIYLFILLYDILF